MFFRFLQIILLPLSSVVRVNPYMLRRLFKFRVSPANVSLTMTLYSTSSRFSSPSRLRMESKAGPPFSAPMIRFPRMTSIPERANASTSACVFSTTLPSVLTSG